MAATAILIDDVCNRVGTNPLNPNHFTRAMCATWLSEAQRTLCIEGPILKSAFQGTSQANVEILSLPVPDFIKISSIHIRRPSSNLYRRLIPMGHLNERKANRTTDSTSVPSKYAVWAGNDASGNSAKGLVFDENFGTTGIAPDIFLFIRQMPKTMEDGGQGPEVTEAWQDVMKDYCEMRARMRMSAMDSEQRALAKACSDLWELGKQRARDTEPEQEDEPALILDNMNYNLDDEY